MEKVLFCATGLLSVVIKSKKITVIKFVNSLELFGIGYSWGGFVSYIARTKKQEKDEYMQGETTLFKK